MIPYSKQSISKNDIAAVTIALKSNFLTKGPLFKKFENKIGKKFSSKYVVVSNSGSSSLHLACLAIGIKKGDIVWTVPVTYAASANCALNCGAKIDFVDICSKTFNISIEELNKKLEFAKKKKKLPKVIIPVHLGGLPYEQKEVWKLSKKYNFKIIEDASHAIGSKHYGENVGSCKWSDITVFSFHPVKIITTAEGGASLTNNKIYYDKMLQFRENGIIFNKKKFLKKSTYSGYYEQISTGYNYRMNELSAALGISQLKNLEKFTKKRNEIAKKYINELKNFPIKFQKIEKYNFSSYHLMIIKFNLNQLKLNYKQIFDKFRKNKIFVNLHYSPLHLNPYFQRMGFKKKQFLNSEDYANTSLSIPNYYDLKKIDFYKVIKIIKSLT